MMNQMKLEHQVQAKWLNILERILFDYRVAVLSIFIVITMFLGFHAAQLRPEASFNRMIPTYHPYIKNYFNYERDLKGLGNFIRICVATPEKDIFSKEYFETLKKIQEDIFYIEGVDRSSLKSLWSAATRWEIVTSKGFQGGPVIPNSFNGSPDALEMVRQNILRSAIVGSMVANDFKSSIIFVPLQEINPSTGKPLDYQKFSNDIELIRNKYQSSTIQIHITGFAKIVGDLIDGSRRVILFFVITFFILIIFLYFSSKCWRSTFVRAASSLTAVAWQLGLLRLFGYGLNPYSMLVPFLMFALGVSHGIQMGNAMTREMMHVFDKLQAARKAFRIIFVPGVAALLTDALGFALLFLIRIGVIQDIAVGATIGVFVVAFTDLMLLPIMMSFTGVSQKSIENLKINDSKKNIIWDKIASLSSNKGTAIVILTSVLLFGFGIYSKKGLKIGDVDPGAPELRVDSRYNKDVSYITGHYAIGNDIFVIMLETPSESGNTDYNVMVAADRLQYQLENLDCVLSTFSLVDYVKFFTSGYSEGNPKWYSLPRNRESRDSSETKSPIELRNKESTLILIYVYLKDHKAETLDSVVSVVEAFKKMNDSEKGVFLLAAGNAGIEAATNIEIRKSTIFMTILVYASVFLVVLFSYRSLRGALSIMIPLYLITVLSESLMASLGIGIKVATLPVIAVGVGIGVDYGIYLYSRLDHYLSEGLIFRDALYRALSTTGKAILFTGITLSVGVGTWFFSPIKFQADMGLLLAFVFLGNMFGALLLLPSLFTLFGIRKKYRKARESKLYQST
jgi:uncharacterized protein